MGFYREKAVTGNAAAYHAAFTVGMSFDAVDPVK
jgi:hypothetical protein